MKDHPSFVEDPMVRLRAVDPLDRQELNDRVALSADAVIAELTSVASLRAVSGATRNPPDRPASPLPVASVRRRRRWMPIAAAVAAVGLIAAVLAGLLPGTSEPAYAISVDNGVVVVNWFRDLRDGSEIGDDLRAYGIDATVSAVPASPSRVGRVLTVAVDGVAVGDMPPGVSWGADGTDEVFTWRIDPSRFDGAIAIEIGVEPEDGEPYQAAESAFAPGEVLGGLHCAIEGPVTSDDVARQVRRLGLTARWYRVVEAPESVDGDLAREESVTTPPSGTVIDVQPLDETTLRVTVAADGARSDAAIFSPVRPAAACTPELASRWTGVI